METMQTMFYTYQQAKNVIHTSMQADVIHESNTGCEYLVAMWTTVDLQSTIENVRRILCLKEHEGSFSNHLNFPFSSL